MIELTTGQPGAGKTLHTLWYVKAKAEREGRQVYFSGIADLRVPGWIELEDATKWHECPPGSIIVIDEAQRVFRPRGTGSAVPAHVAALETHRHAGLDLHLVTQHPKLVDANLRRLVGIHRHVMRAFGAKAAVVHEWNEVRPDPDLSREGSIATSWRYPAEVFGWYKSAEVHTHKARVPARVVLLLLSPLLLGGLAFAAYWLIQRTAFGESSVSKQAGQIVGAPPAGSSGQGGKGSAPKSTATWLAERQPRIAGLAHTAPAYDDVTKPTVAPIPNCVSMRGECRCYSQQATRLDMDRALCESIVERGFFVDWEQRAGGMGAPLRAPMQTSSAGSAGWVPVAPGAGRDGRPAMLAGDSLAAGVASAPRPESQAASAVGHPGRYGGQTPLL